MISVDQAQELIFSHISSIYEDNIEKIYIDDLREEILCENIVADSDYPPFDRVAMDGIAINFEDFQNGIRKFKILYCQKAGDSKQKLVGVGNCFEIMTGAIMSDGADTIIKYEEINKEDGFAILKDDLKVDKNQNVHKQSSDKFKGETLIKKNTIIQPPDWSIIASVGKSSLCVKKRPKIAIVSTGNELVGIDEIPKPYQIRRSNSYGILALLRKSKFNKNSLFHINDDSVELEEKMSKILDNNEVIIISGGVSAGKFDLVPNILSKLRVKKVFHKVSQRPGKPLWFGVIGRKMIFGLPGNPVSSLVCLNRYVIPALNKMLLGENYTNKNIYARIKSSINLNNDLTHFIPAKLEFTKESEIYAKVMMTNGSGDFTSLGGSDGFLEVRNRNNEIGTSCPFFYW